MGSECVRLWPRLILRGVRGMVSWKNNTCGETFYNSGMLKMNNLFPGILQREKVSHGATL